MTRDLSSALEVLDDDALYKLTYTLLYFTLSSSAQFMRWWYVRREHAFTSLRGKSRRRHRAPRFATHLLSHTVITPARQ